MSIDPAKTAVVLIEYQNDFTSEGGVLHGAVEAVMEKTGMLANTERVVEAARSAGATIMHAPIMFAKGYNEISAHPYGILKGVVDGNAFVKGTWGAAITEELDPQEGDIVIEGKRGLDTFASTNLDDRPGRLPDQLLRRVDHAQWLRERLRGDHAQRLRRGHIGGGARQRSQIRLPDVLQTDDV
jgi:nicotinamidase-related amidase